MKARTISRIELGVEVGAAASAAAALGYAVTVLLTGLYVFPAVPGMAVAAIAFTGTREALKRIAPAVNRSGRAKAPVHVLKLSDFVEIGAPVGQGANPATGPQPLTLVEVLAELGDQPGVVRLFDSERRPGANDLAAGVDRHLGEDSGTSCKDVRLITRRLSAPEG